MIGYVDSHCHITCEDFNEDLKDVIVRMKETPLVRALIICCVQSEYAKTLQLVKSDPLFDMAAGIHPSDQKKLTDEWWNEFLEYAKKPEVKVIGEIGLDYHWDQDNVEAQKALFIKQIELANSLNKPVSVHSRDAAKDTFDILKEHRCKGIIHCYSGSLEMAKEYVKLGYYISLGGPVTYKNSKDPKKVAAEIDIDHLMTETDCPYLTPVPLRGQRNEPSYVKYTAKMIAELRGIEEEELLEHVVSNYDRFIGK